MALAYSYKYHTTQLSFQRVTREDVTYTLNNAHAIMYVITVLYFILIHVIHTVCALFYMYTYMCVQAVDQLLSVQE